MPQLTFTRFIAAMAVVVFHWSLHTPGLAAAIRDVRVLLGPTMVSYFFVLSGFIMAIVYVRPGQAVDPWKYWGRRVARIYPVYMLGVVWMAALLHSGIGDTRHDAMALLLSASMLQAWFPAFALSVNAPGWSLSAEAFFYLTFPLLAVAVRLLRTPGMVLLATAACWLIGQGVFHWALMRLNANDAVVVHEFLHYNPLMHLNSFIVGVGVGTVLNQRLPLKTVAGNSGSGWPLVVFVLSLVLIVALTLNLGAINAYFNVPFSPTNGLFAPLFALSIVALGVDRTWFSRLLKLRIPIALGEISYGVYILHIPVAWSVRSAVPQSFVAANQFAMFTIYIAALLGAAYVSYRWLETPLRRLLRKRLEPRTGPVTTLGH